MHLHVALAVCILSTTVVTDQHPIFYQVRNLRPCTKVAVDFLTPASMEQCATLRGWLRDAVSGGGLLRNCVPCTLHHLLAVLQCGVLVDMEHRAVLRGWLREAVINEHLTSAPRACCSWLFADC